MTWLEKCKSRPTGTELMTTDQVLLWSQGSEAIGKVRTNRIKVCQEGKFHEKEEQYRKTPFFDRFIEFDLK